MTEETRIHAFVCGGMFVSWAIIFLALSEAVSR